MYFGEVALTLPTLDRPFGVGGGSACVPNLWALNEPAAALIAIWERQSWPK